MDGAFFLHRYSRCFADSREHSPAQVAKTLHKMALEHCNRDLYRLFYYDCPPLQKKAHNPITRRAIDFSKKPEAIFRLQLFEELKKLRKVALRLGHLQGDMIWNIRPRRFRELLSGAATLPALSEQDVFCDVRQKGVDMKLGVDVATLALKRLVDRIVLIAGDADFVPAAKLARREGIDFILDPMWNPVPDSLFEHIDGLVSKSPRPARRAAAPSPPDKPAAS